MILVRNDSLSVLFDHEKGALRIANASTGQSLDIAGAGHLLTGGSEQHLRTITASPHPCSFCQVPAEHHAVMSIPLDDPHLLLHADYRLSGSVLQITCTLENTSDATFFVRDFVPLKGYIAGSTIEGSEGQLVMLDTDSLATVAGTLAVKEAQTPNAQPLFVDQWAFMGIDWAAAENLFYKDFVLCREICASHIGPGARFQFRPFSIGTAGPGLAHRDFLQHLYRQAGKKPAEHVSFYFDGLTHGSEGPTDDELACQTALFERLNREFGIRFDIFSADDGVLETGGVYWDDYSSTHDILYCHARRPSGTFCLYST